MSDIAKFLGLRIRELRNQRRMSQEELAFQAGISAAHLGQIERATKNPTVDTVGKIASALGVPVVALFSEDWCAPAPPEKTVIGKINAHLSSMSEEDQHDILRIIRIFRGYKQRER